MLLSMKVEREYRNEYVLALLKVGGHKNVQVLEKVLVLRFCSS